MRDGIGLIWIAQCLKIGRRRENVFGQGSQGTYFCLLHHNMQMIGTTISIARTAKNNVGRIFATNETLKEKRSGDKLAT